MLFQATAQVALLKIIEKLGTRKKMFSINFALMKQISNGYSNQMLKALNHLSVKVISLSYLRETIIDL